MIGIYKITSPSKRIYIGQSINIKKRFISYRNKECICQTRLYASFNKYGVDKHKFEIVTECDVDDLNKWERYYQDLYHCTGRSGLNCKLTKYGDRCGSVSDDTRKRMSDAQIKSQSINKRIHYNLSEETKEKIRQKAIGRPSPFKGVKVSEEIRLSMKLRKNYSCPIWRKNNSLSKIGKRTGEENHKSKLVLNIETGIYYSSIIEASSAYNINSRTLKNKLNGNKRNNSSFIFANEIIKYKKELSSNEKNQLQLKKAKVIFLDTHSGIFYFTITDAATAVGVNKNTLTAWLRDKKRNKTNIISTYN